MKKKDKIAREGGAVLVVGLIVLLLVTLIGFGAIRSNVMELRMANNAAIKNEAFHQAQAGLDFLLAHPELLPVRGAAGYTYCTLSLGNGRSPCRTIWYPCDETTLDLPAPLDDSSVGSSALQMTLGAAGLPRGFATSGRLFDAASFTAQSCFDDTVNGRGNAAIDVGVVLLIPKM